MICENSYTTVEDIMKHYDLSRFTIFRDYEAIKKHWAVPTARKPACRNCKLTLFMSFLFPGHKYPGILLYDKLSLLKLTLKIRSELFIVPGNIFCLIAMA